jgi:hypothetical protein
MDTNFLPKPGCNPPSIFFSEKIYLVRLLGFRKRIPANSALGALTTFKSYGILIVETSHDHFPAAPEAFTTYVMGYQNPPPFAGGRSRSPTGTTRQAFALNLFPANAIGIRDLRIL